MKKIIPSKQKTKKTGNKNRRGGRGYFKSKQFARKTGVLLKRGLFNPVGISVPLWRQKHLYLFNILQDHFFEVGKGLTAMWGWEAEHTAHGDQTGRR